MIRRRHIFSPNPRAEFWRLVDECSSAQHPDEKVAGVFTAIASLAIYQGTWRGAVLEWAWAVFDVVMCALVAVVPLPVRVLGWRRAWGVRWLGWIAVSSTAVNPPPGTRVVLPPVRDDVPSHWMAL